MKKVRLVLTFAAMLAAAGLVAGCVEVQTELATPIPSVTPVPPAPPTAAASPTPVPTARPTEVILPAATAETPIATGRPGIAELYAAEWGAWSQGPHANTYGLEKGPNTYCARCHSPQNWDVLARIDEPPNCVSCKFPTDPKVREAAHNRLVPAEEWQSIGCEVCHQIRDGTMIEGIAWLNRQSDGYQPLDSPTELCQRCHADTDTLRHGRDLGQAVHQGFKCTSCHDPHSAVASCVAAGCHEGIATPPAAGNPAPVPGHDAAHARLDCVACHDAAGLAVGPVKATGDWTTWRTTELLGRKSTTTYQSHNIGQEVDCARCHFSGNAWGLTEDVTPKP